MKSYLINKTDISGFTLIELIVVIVLLSIVTLSVIPRFINFQDDARLSQVQRTASAFKSAVNLVQLTFLSQSRNTRTQNLPGFGAENVDTNNIGFPIGIDKGNVTENIGRGVNGCEGIWNGILQSAITASGGTSTDYQTYRHTSSKVCSYVYRLNGDTAGRRSALLVIQYDSRDGQVFVCGTQPEIKVCPF